MMEVMDSHPVTTLYLLTWVTVLWLAWVGPEVWSWVL